MATIFLVDDERILRTLLRFALEQRGHRVIEARSARQAITLSQRHKGVIEVLVASVSLPGGSGLSLSELLGAGRPSMQTLLISRVPHSEELLTEARATGTRVLVEPFEAGELLDSIQAALASGRRRPPSRSGRPRAAAHNATHGG